MMKNINLVNISQPPTPEMVTLPAKFPDPPSKYLTR